MVLDAILKAYAFLVAGLFVPTLGAYFWRQSTSSGAFWGMICGGSTTLALLISGAAPPLGLDPSFWGILASALVFVPVSILTSEETDTATETEEEASLA
jgi:SSS family solute:Na+ symporter